MSAEKPLSDDNIRAMLHDRGVTKVDLAREFKREIDRLKARERKLVAAIRAYFDHECDRSFGKALRAAIEEDADGK